jgi:hypothetical protein
MTSRQEWLKLRMGSIGASDAVVLLRGPQYGKTEEDIRDSKIEEQVEASGSDIRRGQLYEHIALSEYSRITGELVETAGTDDPMALYFCVGYCHASLDGLARLGDGAVRILEVKCPRGKKATDTKYLGPTQEWEIQSRYQQAVYHISTGAARDKIAGRMVVWNSEEAEYTTHEIVMSNEQWEEALGWVAYCDDWYFRHVANREPIMPRAPQVPIKAFETIHLADPNESMIIQSYARVSAQIKELEAEKSLLSKAMDDVFNKNQARKMIADGGVTITRVVQPGRTTLSVEAARRAMPDVDWGKYERKGADFVTWRVGGGK